MACLLSPCMLCVCMQMSNRMAQQNAFHLFAALWLCAAVLFVFLTLDSWIRVSAGDEGILTHQY